MCMMQVDGAGSLQHRARFLCEFTLFAEEEDSSIVLLHNACQIPSFVFEACSVALAQSALPTLAGLSRGRDG